MVPSAQHPRSHGRPDAWFSCRVARRRDAAATSPAAPSSGSTTNQDGVTPKSLAGITRRTFVDNAWTHAHHVSWQMRNNWPFTRLGAPVLELTPTRSSTGARATWVAAMKPLHKKANRQISVLLRRPLSQDHERR